MIPTATASSGSGAIRAFTPTHVALATFLGSPIAGGILMMINARRAGRGGVVWLLAGMALTAALFAVGTAIPSPAGNAVAIVGIVAMLQLAKREEPLLGPCVPASGWAAAGIAVLTLVFVLGGVVGYFVLDQPPAVHYGHDQDVQYTSRATEKEAHVVGDFLRDEGYFSDHGATVRVARHGNDFVVSLVLVDGYWDKPDAQEAFADMRKRLADAMPGYTIVLALCDDDFDVKREIR